MSAKRKRRLFLSTVMAACLVPMAALIDAQPAERVIKVVARRYAYAPGEIHLKKGERVVLELTSLDVVMGFNAPDFGVRSDVVPGTTARVRIMPDKTGKFTFHCDIFCGSGHEDMAGVIVVA